MYFYLVADKQGPKTSNVLVDCKVQEMSLKDESVTSNVMKMGSVCEVFNTDNNNNHEKEAPSVCFEESETTAKEKATNGTLNENENQTINTNTRKARKKKQKKASKGASSTPTTTRVVDSKSQKVDDDKSLEGTYHINVTGRNIENITWRRVLDVILYKFCKWCIFQKNTRVHAQIFKESSIQASAFITREKQVKEYARN